MSLAAAENCPICLGPVNAPFVMEACSHAFCMPCIATWVLKKWTCPKCNKLFSNLDFTRLVTDPRILRRESNEDAGLFSSTSSKNKQRC